MGQLLLKGQGDGAKCDNQAGGAGACPVVPEGGEQGTARDGSQVIGKTLVSQVSSGELARHGQGPVWLW